MVQVPGERPSPTPRYYKVLGRAAEIARGAGSPGIRAEHLLLAIIREPQSIPAQVLASLADLNRTEAAVQDALPENGEPPAVPAGSLPPAAPATGAWGARTAAALGHAHIGVEHVFLEAIQDHASLAAQALGHSVDPGQAESAVRSILNSPGYLGLPDPGNDQKQFLPGRTGTRRSIAQGHHRPSPGGRDFRFQLGKRPPLDLPGRSREQSRHPRRGPCQPRATGLELN